MALGGHARDETGDGCIAPLLESAKSGGINLNLFALSNLWEKRKQLLLSIGCVRL